VFRASRALLIAIATSGTRTDGVAAQPDGPLRRRRHLEPLGHREARHPDDLATRLERLDPHTAAMLEAAWRLGGDPAFARLHLRRHAHGLGYGGHRVSKSPSWSTTFAELARARFEWREARRAERLGEGTTIESRLHPVGVGWANRGEALWAHYRRKSRDEERQEGWFIASTEGWAA